METARRNLHSFIAQTQGLTTVPSAPAIQRPSAVNVVDAHRLRFPQQAETIPETPPQGTLPPAWKGAVESQGNATAFVSAFPCGGFLDYGISPLKMTTMDSPADLIGAVVQETGGVFLSNVFNKYDLLVADRSALTFLACMDEARIRGSDSELLRRIRDQLEGGNFDDLLTSTTTASDGGCTAALLIAAVALADHAHVEGIAQLEGWWELLAKCRGEGLMVSPPKSTSISGRGTFHFQTKRDDPKNASVMLSRLALFPLPYADRVTAKANESTSSIKIVRCNTTEQVLKSAGPVKSGWARHAAAATDSALAHTVSSHPHSRSATIEFEHTNQGVTPLLLCGELSGSLDLCADMVVPCPADWTSILRDVCEIAALNSLKSLVLQEVEKWDPLVSCLLSTGTCETGAAQAIDPGILGKLYASCRAVGEDEHWQGLIHGLTAAVSHLSSDWERSVAAVRQQWLLHWRPVLQGSDNGDVRTRLLEVCTFVTRRLSSGQLPPNTVLGILYKLLEKGLSLETLEKAVENGHKLCKGMVSAMHFIKCMDNERAILGLLPMLTPNPIAPYAGGPAESLAMVSYAIFHSVAEGLKRGGTDFNDIAAAVAAFSQESLSAVASNLESGFWTKMLSTLDLVSPAVEFNSVISTAKGARISPAPSGGVLLDCSRMGDVCARGSQVWDVAHPLGVQYFECSLLSRGYKAIVIGFSQPNREANTLAKAMSARHRMHLGGGPNMITVSKGDTIGCGVHEGWVIFTLNGVVLYREGLRKAKDGSVETPRLVPFAYFDTTDATSTRVNFGESSFLYPICPRTNTRGAELLVTTALKSDSPLFSGVFGACINSTGRLGWVVEGALCRTLEDLEDDHVIALTNRLSQDDGHGGALMAKAMEVFDFLEVDYNAIAKATLEGMMQQGPGGLSSRNAALFWLPSTGVSVEGNIALLGDSDAEAALCIGSVLPHSQAVSFSITLGSPPGSSGELAFIGSYYVGVTSSVGMELMGWQNLNPIQCWALHANEGEQLGHAEVKPRYGGIPLFHGNSVVVVTVDRLAGTASFSCDGDDLGIVFRNIPSNVDLRPFVQLVGVGSSVSSEYCIYNGPALDSVLEYSSKVALARSLLTQPQTFDIIADWVEKNAQQDSRGLCDILGCAPNHGYVSVNHEGGSVVGHLVARASSGGFRVRFPNGTTGEVSDVMLSPLTTFVADPMITVPQHGVADGVRRCVRAACRIVSEWETMSLGLGRLCHEESEVRKGHEEEAMRQLRSIVVLPPPTLGDLWQRNSGLVETMLGPVTPPPVPTFSISESHSKAVFPLHYNGSLMLAPHSSDDGACVGVGNAPLPVDGQFNLRFILDCDWLGMLPYQIGHLGESYRVGVCTIDYRGEGRVNSSVSRASDLWAIPAVGTLAATQRNSTLPPLNTRYFDTMDKVRLSINREKGTIELYVTPLHGGERFVGVAFKDIPRHVELYPFVQIGPSRGSALMLPEASLLPRPTVEAPHNLRILSKAVGGYLCDGCSRGLSSISVKPPNWYRCNQCNSYDLCADCFAGHVHPGHTFTQMAFAAVSPSPVRLVVQPDGAKRQQHAEVAALPVRIAKVCGSGVVRSSLAVEKRGDSWAAGVWALFRRPTGKTSTEVRVRFFREPEDSTPEPVRVILGAGLWSEVCDISDPLAFAELANADTEQGAFPKVVAMDTDEVQAIGGMRDTDLRVNSGDTLSVVVSSGEIRLYARGVCVKSSEVSLGNLPVSVFVSFIGADGLMAELYHPNGTLVSGKVCERVGNCVRVAAGANSRWCENGQLREPLGIIDTASAITRGLRVYVPSTNGFRECVACDVSQLNDNVVTLDDGSGEFTYPAGSVWVPASVNVQYQEESSMPFRDEMHRMRRFYAKYAPEKTDDEMYTAIQKFSTSSLGIPGMFAALVKKYGPEPAIELIRPLQERAGKNESFAIDGSKVVSISRLLLLIARYGDSTLSGQDAVALASIASIGRVNSLITPGLLHSPISVKINAASGQQATPIQYSSQSSIDGMWHIHFAPQTSFNTFGLQLQPWDPKSRFKGVGCLTYPGVMSNVGVEAVPEGVSGGFTIYVQADGTVAAALQRYLDGRSRVEIRRSTLTGPAMLEVQVVSGANGNFNVDWWGARHHHGPGMLKGALPCGIVGCGLLTSLGRDDSRDVFVDALATAASLARANLISASSISNATYRDICSRPQMATRMCSMMDGDLLGRVFQDGLKEAAHGRYLEIVPIVGKQLWVQNRDSSVLLAIASLAIKHWNNCTLLRNLVPLASPPELASAMAPLLAPLRQRFETMARNHTPCRELQGAATDVFYSLGIESSYLPLKLLTLLDKVANAHHAGDILPTITMPGNHWVDALPTSIHTTSLIKGAVMTDIPATLPTGGMYFEVVQPTNGRVEIVVGGSSLQTYIAFDGMSARRQKGPWRPFGDAIVKGGCVLGCHLHDESVTFSVNGRSISPIKLKFHPRIARINLDLSDAPLAVYSELGSTQFLPQGAVALHERTEDVEKSISFGPTGATSKPDDLKLFVAKGIGMVLPFVDPSESGSPGRTTLVRLKGLVDEKFRHTVLAPLKPLKKGDRHKIPTVTVKWFQLFSSTTRSPDEALRATVLAQLHGQLSSPLFYEQNPMFVTSLSMTDSAHTPVDAGGPYKAVWGLVSEEIMTVESEKPNFHRNPMFVLTDSKDRKVMVPNRQCEGFAHLYRFLGTIMGHMARAKSPMALDFSPFVWKFLVGDAVTVDDYYSDVDTYFKPLLDDDELLADDERAGEAFPGFAHRMGLEPTHDLSARRGVAKACVLGFFDGQLIPMREGLAASIGDDVLPFMTWRDLERSVCGDPNPTFEQVKSSISCNLPEPHQTMFWEALAELSPLQWGQFFGFCSAQRRFPLSKKIVIVPDRHASVKHLPVAQTCFSQLRTPLYTSSAMFLEQLKKCIVSEEMELA